MVKPGDITSVPTHPADDDVEGLDSEIAISQNEELLLEQVEAAFERIEAGTYGVCQQCGRTTDLQRLQAVPYASRCIDCDRCHRDVKKSRNRCVANANPFDDRDSGAGKGARCEVRVGRRKYL